MEVYWPHDMKYYLGSIKHYDEGSRKHTINYDDGEVEILVVTQEKRKSLSRERNFTIPLKNLGDMEFKSKSELDYMNNREVFGIIVSEPLDSIFLESYCDEIKGFWTEETEIPEGDDILKSRVQHSLKNSDRSEKFKTRLIIQGHKDPDKEKILKEIPTILRSSFV